MKDKFKQEKEFLVTENKRLPKVKPYAPTAVFEKIIYLFNSPPVIGPGKDLSLKKWKEEGAFKNLEPLIRGNYKDVNIQDLKFNKFEDPKLGKYEGLVNATTGKPEGLGRFIHKNNKIEEGFFEDSKLNGDCRIFVENGNFYEGLAKNGVKDGHGSFYEH